MAVGEVHKGDIGTIFEVTLEDGGVAVDVSSAVVTKDIKVKPPIGATKTFPATFKTDGTDGIIQYTTVVDDIDEEGEWSIQAFVVITAGTFNSDIDKFIVYENL